MVGRSPLVASDRVRCDEPTLEKTPMADNGQKPRSVSPIGRSPLAAIGRVSGSMSRWLTKASAIRAGGAFLRRQLWAWPIVAAILFGGAGWAVHRTVESAMREQRAVDLNTMVDASVTAVRVWIGEQRINVQLFADDAELRPLVASLLALANGDDGAKEAKRRSGT